MLPRWHILVGALFALLIWFFSPEINPFYLVIVFFASVFIDFDHYACAVLKTKKIGLKCAFDYHSKACVLERKEIEKGLRKKGDFHLFHTIEFHVLIGIIGVFNVYFFYLFIGMVFHSLFDLFSLIYNGRMHRREYFFFNWLRKRF